MMQTFTDSPYKAFSAEVTADLAGKQNYVVEIVPGKETIRLATAATTLPIGTIFNQLPNSNQFTVRLFGKGGTMKVIAGGVINTPDQVVPLAGGKVGAGATGNRTVGIKIAPGAASADGDVIEIIDALEISL